MPYALSLQAHTPPEFYTEPPVEWVRRLAEVSEKTDKMAALHFRWFEPRAFWRNAERGQWVLYAGIPRHLVEAERAEMFQSHWSEMPTEGQRMGRQGVVSNYQHFCWHTLGVDARPFLVLQGGGTPAQYTPRERRYLAGVGAPTQPVPLGYHPACPFDERIVRAIQLRDRLIQAERSFDALQKMDNADALRAEDDAAERLYRETFLETWRAVMAPSVEFMQGYLRKSEATMTLPKATPQMANAVTEWKDHWREFGTLPGVKTASSKKVAVSMAAPT
jgi:hypothetical protein